MSCRGVSHKQLLRQYDMEKAEETLTNKETQRDDMQAQKVTQSDNNLMYYSCNKDLFQLLGEKYEGCCQTALPLLWSPW